MTNIYCSWDIIGRDGKQVGATDRPTHAEAMRRLGYGVIAHHTTVDADEAGIDVVNSVAWYLPPLEKEQS
jgi:hypothetical protein